MDLSQTVFVFGSNLAGIHGAGAALHARQHKGARPGKGSGFQGLSYAIPTKDEQLRRLSLSDIRRHVARFIEFANDRKDLTFQVTRVGCGLAGYADSSIEPLFNTPDNCLLPGTWLRRRDPRLYRVIVAGSRTVQSSEAVAHAHNRVSRVLRNVVADRRNTLEIVSGLARSGGDQIGKDWAEQRNIHVEPFPADWKRFNKAAGFLRNTDMAWYGTHLLALWDGRSTGTRHMIARARAEGLALRVLHCKQKLSQ